MKSYTKDVDAILDYSFDWSDWLVTGESIITVVWTLPAGITKVTESNTTTTATVWISGGTEHTSYKVACKITTDSTPTARVDERTFKLLIQER